MASLGEAQRDFTRCVGKLIEFAYAEGFELTFGEALRTPEMARVYAARGDGIINSLHVKKLAVDFNLFRDGKWLRMTEDHAPLGAFWKTLDPRARWGGDWEKRKDGNHYSFEWEGVQ